MAAQRSMGEMTAAGRRRLWVAAGVGTLLLSGRIAQANTYTYTNSLADATSWNDGTAAHWDAKPVSASDTALVFNGAPANTGVTISSDNNIGTPTATNFTLNSMNLAMTGQASGTSAVVNITGYPLEFIGTGATLTVGGGGTRAVKWNIATAIQLDADLTINAAAATNGNNNAVISSNGSFGIIKTGTGSFNINVADTYTGTTTVLAGILTVTAASGGGGAINASSGYIVDGGTLALGKSGSGNATTDMLNNSAAVTLSRGGKLQITSDQSTGGQETIGSLAVSSGASSYVANDSGSGKELLTALAFSRTNNGTALIALKSGGVGNVSRMFLTNTAGLSFVGADTATSGAATTDTALRIIPYLIGGTSPTSVGDNFVTYDSTAGIRTLQAGEQVTLSDAYTAPASHENAIAAATTSLANPTVNSLLFNSSVALSGSGSLTIDSGAIDVIASVNAGISGFSGLNLKNGEGVIQVVGGSLTITPSLTVSGTTTEINSNGGGLTKSGAGILTLRGQSNYTGPTNINQGTLIFATAAALYGGNSASWTADNLRVKTGGTIGFNVGGTGELTSAQINTLLTNLAASTSVNSGMNAGTSILFDTSNATGGTFAITAALTDSTGSSGGQRSFIKQGSNALVLSGTNTYSGTTSVTAGTIEFVNQASLYNGATASWSKANINVASGATFALRVGGTGQFTVSNINTLQSNLKSGSATGGIQAGATIALDTTDAAGGSFTYNLTGITDRATNTPGSINFAKIGTNTLVTTIANPYTGTTAVTGGTFTIDAGTGHTLAALSGTTSVAVTATTSTDTVLSLVSVAASGATANLINDGATLVLATNGSLSGKINLSFTDSTVIEKVAGLTINGVAQPTGFYSATSAPVAGDTAFFTGTGTIQVVPEPASLGLTMLAGLGLLRRRLRR